MAFKNKAHGVAVINQNELFKHLKSEHHITRQGKITLVIDGIEYRKTSLNKFLTNKKLKALDSDILELDDTEKKAAINTLASRLISNVQSVEDKYFHERTQIDSNSVLAQLETSEVLMDYRPVKDLRTGETFMFCTKSEMLADMDYTSWLELAPGDAKKIRPQPCIAVYDPVDMRLCYAGEFQPTHNRAHKIPVLYINEHIKPEWRQ